jgi:carbamoyltransferase
MSYILGVNLSHDRSAALVRDGEVVVAVEEERLDRIKHSEGFLVQGHFERLTKTIPMKSIAYCLEVADIGIDELDLVIGNRPLGDGAVWRLLRELPIKDKSKVRAFPLPSHHLAHAVTAYYCSPWDEAAVLVVDQAGSRDNHGIIEKHTAFRAAGTAVEPVAAASYPVDYTDLSLGLFYDFFTVKLGFVTRYGTPEWGVFNCGGYPEAGKTMGLAPYGRPRPEWGTWLTLDGFDVTVSQDELEQIWKSILAADGADSQAPGIERWESRFAKDVAFKVQEELERALLHLAAETHRLVGGSRLCMAGGVMLNSVANQRVATEGPFDEVFVPAPSGDSGVAIGAALYGWHVLLGQATRRGMMRTAALGRQYDRTRVDSALERCGEGMQWQPVELAEVARLLADGQIVGWFVGGSEVGPRALGHRSILADPRSPGVRDYLNRTVKHREPFRPYAPSVLTEHVSEWFDFTGESPFMLLVPNVRADRREQVPAITHVDGSARVQTVSARTDPEYHQLITEFQQLTGVPLLLNTSFNDNGEPIVETPEDALRTFSRTELDYLYLEGYLVSKPGRARPAGHPAADR